MMDTQQKGILTLIRSAMTEQSLPLPDGFDLEQACRMIQCHQIDTLAYDGAIRCGIPKGIPVMRRMFERYCHLMICSEKQTAAIEKLSAAFEDRGIAYMPLKGCGLKKLYPKPELRQMGDADILIRMEQYAQIKPIVQELGYREVVESDHELIWNNGVLQLELHKRLIPSYNRDYDRYFGDGWQLAVCDSGSCYHMKPENALIYLFTHFAKHYRDGGIGLRHVIDLWVYMERHQLCERYVEQELEALHLLEFYKNVRKLIGFWFCDESGDEKTAFLSNMIFNSGSWGSKESHAAGAGAKAASAAGSLKKGEAMRWLRAFFPGVSSLRLRYPILKKAPVLLPAVWLYRFADVLLTRRKNVRKQLEALRVVSLEQIQTYQQALNYVGLDYHFEE